MKDYLDKFEIKINGKKYAICYGIEQAQRKIRLNNLNNLGIVTCTFVPKMVIKN